MTFPIFKRSSTVSPVLQAGPASLPRQEGVAPTVFSSHCFSHALPWTAASFATLAVLSLGSGSQAFAHGDLWSSRHCNSKDARTFPSIYFDDLYPNEHQDEGYYYYHSFPYTTAGNTCHTHISFSSEGVPELELDDDDEPKLDDKEGDPPEVVQENRPPEVVRQRRDVTFPRPGMDPNDRKTWGLTNDLSRYFRDPDGDSLIYTATSSDPFLVRAVTTGDRLTYNAVPGRSPGNAIVTVTASDGKASASFSFVVSVLSIRPESSRPETQPEEPKEEKEEDPLLDDDTVDAALGEALEKGGEEAVEEFLEKLGKESLEKLGKRILGPLGFVGDLRSIGELAGLIWGTESSKRRTREMEEKNKQDQQKLERKQQEKQGREQEAQPGNEQAPQSGVGDQSNSGIGALFNDFATTLYVHQDALRNGNFSLAQAFSGRQFAYPFSLVQGEAENRASAKRFNGLLTGSVDFSRFRDDSGDSDMDGHSTAYRLGMAVLPNPEAPLVTGLQLAFTRADVDFKDRESTSEGDYALRLFTVSPAVVWDATENLTLWGGLGYGRGETEGRCRGRPGCPGRHFHHQHR
ncbi:MAG: hypothetical protein F4Z10_08265 [Synechococcus sp. SB0666_bin_14]|nr:hypothetical protein [Synechococcus sp. SB0666_bin_14]MYG47637.1 hypothetical protein [Synechococcus sp. SB0675_bin_6]MYK91830.1 hypothetical protein [Synechococcus sp. SB0669_bin_8]